MPRFYETTLSITNLHNLSISTHVNRSRINMLEKLKEFPTTTDVCIYFSTFNMLRKLYLSLDDYNYPINYLFHNPLAENTTEYISRINRLYGGEILL